MVSVPLSDALGACEPVGPCEALGELDLAGRVTAVRVVVLREDDDVLDLGEVMGRLFVDLVVVVGAYF